jgi:hypothetical protein
LAKQWRANKCGAVYAHALDPFLSFSGGGQLVFWRRALAGRRRCGGPSCNSFIKVMW